MELNKIIFQAILVQMKKSAQITRNISLGQLKMELIVKHINHYFEII